MHLLMGTVINIEIASIIISVIQTVAAGLYSTSCIRYII